MILATMMMTISTTNGVYSVVVHHSVVFVHIFCGWGWMGDVFGVRHRALQQPSIWDF
jgi:hypothetical protein